MKVLNITGLFIITIALLWNTGCHKNPYLDGNGNVITETRASVSFNRIENQADLNVYYVHDTIFRVVIEAESNLIPYIETRVNGNTLEIDTKGNLQNNYTMKVTVYSPVMVGVALSGSGLIDINYFITEHFEAVLSGSGVIYGNVKTDYFEALLSGSGEIDFGLNSTSTKAIISGSGNVKLSGVSVNSEYVISGSGNIESYSMPVNQCTAIISGSGNIYTTVSDFLKITISGSGNLYYQGDPNFEISITGSGSVIKN